MMVLENFLTDADILWDRAGKKLFEKPEARTGRIMRVQVTNRGVVEDLTGYTLNLGWKSTVDETKFGLDAFEPVGITKGIFELEYTSGMLTNIGTLKATLQLVPVAGNTVESDNFVITVTKSAVDAEAIQSETSFTALAMALVDVNAWNATISGKVIDWEADMEATKQLYIDTLNDAEAAYPQELVSLQGQLADIRSAMTGGIEAVELLTGDGSLTYWQTVKGGYYYAVLGSVTGQPSPSGLVQVIRVGTDFSVLWHDLTSQNVYRLYGSATVLSGWSLISGMPVRFVPTLLNGWVNFGKGFAPVKYWKGPDNMVHIGGLIKNGVTSEGAVIFTLPSGFRPEYKEIFTITQDNAVGRIDVYDDGNVIVVKAGAVSTSLAGLSFLAKK